MTVRIQPSVPPTAKSVDLQSFREAGEGQPGLPCSERLPERRPFALGRDGRVWMLPPEVLTGRERRIERLSRFAGFVAIAFGVTALFFTLRQLS